MSRMRNLYISKLWIWERRIIMDLIGIELEHAIEIIKDNVPKKSKAYELSLWDANKRILAEDIYSPIDNPPFDKSPLDGFALRSQDLKGASKANPIRISVVDVIYAGHYSLKELKAGQAARIMTGAPIPSGADCVIRLEDVEEEDGFIIVSKELKHHDNYCFKGEDVIKGTHILSKGEKITYIEQGILASLGIDRVKVYDKPRLALLVTGDELVAPGKELALGKIYDSNLTLLYSRLSELGFEPVIADYLPDNPSLAADKLKEVCKKADIIVTTGGVSVGDKDILHEVLPLMGAKRLFWRVNLKPGTPAMFATYEDRVMFHLSGNPFAAVTTFELLVRPYLAKVSKDKDLDLNRKKAILDNDFTKESKGRRFIRARETDGTVTIPQVSKHASGILSSMIGCNCLIDIPAGSPKLAKGTEVEIIYL